MAIIGTGHVVCDGVNALLSFYVQSWCVLLIVRLFANNHQWTCVSATPFDQLKNDLQLQASDATGRCTWKHNEKYEWLGNMAFSYTIYHLWPQCHSPGQSTIGGLTIIRLKRGNSFIQFGMNFEYLIPESGHWHILSTLSLSKDSIRIEFDTMLCHCHIPSSNRFMRCYSFLHDNFSHRGNHVVFGNVNSWHRNTVAATGSVEVRMCDDTMLQRSNSITWESLQVMRVLVVFSRVKKNKVFLRFH